jgi:hypothetical protein
MIIQSFGGSIAKASWTKQMLNKSENNKRNIITMKWNLIKSEYNFQIKYIFIKNN